ncbi:mucin TcMUCII [Trypanosoma cruzi]|uniref:Mucin TcMUCII, putative n=2 Tax=Trypanosoma cruzi TaxID=5693 RepID=Q4DI89_TRYCC|nr:mucin TcMUCII, putative [Trypanosoma cruzi]EAN92249.1 mucin TcMUCII, putative [Trypanosoma cruzi]RNC53251.1 mucin TcMUCII [Trypanosoma cruzi]|eukprot:XP_814100.1 mucin TcMUCII [Trypanosoma cruzi strain CL Brener]
MCRLLCALLVLALCCCPSVCVVDTAPTEVVTGGSGGSLPSTTPETSSETQDAAEASQLPSPEEDTSLDLENQVDARGKDTNPPSAAAEGALRSNGESGSRSQESGAAQGNTASSLPPGPATDPSKKTETDPGDKDNSKKIVAPEDTFETTTTTTTKAPATTTTTTTAPEAPNDTAMNAEAPTTTTTRAPSRLRETDGSFSSSAWVRAPLLLAVSALAYTTLG